ncbi:MAG: FAD-dependent oxidoreductase [Vicinamibacterales bacterium]
MSDSSTARIDLTNGIPIDRLTDGSTLAGRVNDADVVLVRRGDRFYAVSAMCTHYHGELADGLVAGETIRCPLHHASFSLVTGEALFAPALDPLDTWRVEVVGHDLFVREKLAPQTKPVASRPSVPSSVVIVGGGAAGHAAADMLRRQGYEGPVTILSADADPPVDRPNLSKDFLEGTAPDEWMPLWPAERYRDHNIDVDLTSRVTSIDTGARALSLDNHTTRSFGALLLATGAEPIRVPINGAPADRVLYLRSFADSRLIVEHAKASTHVVVIGASFIGLEAAMALRSRGIAVDVVAPDKVPLERVLGPEVGQFVRSLHESNGVVFHLDRTVAGIQGRTVTLSDNSTITGVDFVLVGAGVKPATALAEQAGLTVDRGIVVNAYLETSTPGIYAAGDVARYPDARTGSPVRIEHWVVAQQQGQVAARNMLGARERFTPIPFFWSRHYNTTIRYTGHAERWDRIVVDGSLERENAMVSYYLDGVRLAVATVGRDRENLEVEQEFERETR